jgi:hypothetical protein
MSCCNCNCNPCCCSTTTCNAASEPLSSALDNFISAFFGDITKTCVNNQVVWTLPCDLDVGIPGYPRIEGEGLACYMLRVFQALTGSAGFTSTEISDTDIELTAGTSTVSQEFFGTITSPMVINALLTDAAAGNIFSISFGSGIVTDAVNTLTFQSDGTDLVVLNEVGTNSGFIELTYTGTEWVVTKLVVNVSV